MFENLRPETSRPQSRLFSVKTTASVIAGNWDGPNGPVDAGTVLTVDAEGLAELQGSIELLHEIGPGGAPLPKRPSLAEALKVTRTPPPAAWADLPPSFSTAATLKNEHECLRTELRLAEAEVRREGFKADYLNPDNAGATRAERNRDRARDALQAFDQKALTSKLVEASRVTLHAISKANLAREKLLATAFEIFSVRLAALELAELKRHQLFGGSGTWSRYVEPVNLKLSDGDRRVWDHTGDVIDEPLESLVSRYRFATARQAEVERLQALADAELAAAQAPVEAPAKRK